MGKRGSCLESQCLLNISNVFLLFCSSFYMLLVFLIRTGGQEVEELQDPSAHKYKSPGQFPLHSSIVCAHVPLGHCMYFNVISLFSLAYQYSVCVASVVLFAFLCTFSIHAKICICRAVGVCFQITSSRIIYACPVAPAIGFVNFA